jgi:hypothetical protein
MPVPPLNPCVDHPLPSGDSPPAGVGDDLPPVSPRTVPALPPEPGKIENRSDSGQFRSDFKPQPSTPDPRPYPLPLWSLQPDEPAADFQLFAAWLQLPAPRHFTKVAPILGCSLYRLRRLSARHRWKTRAAAFDQHRANAAKVALDQILHDETSTWKERAQRFRNEEWLLHEQMLEAARRALEELQTHPGRARLKDILELYELASVLGRRACGMPLDPAAAAAAHPEPPPHYLEAQAALHKIYGEPLPSSSGGTNSFESP